MCSYSVINRRPNFISNHVHNLCCHFSYFSNNESNQQQQSNNEKNGMQNDCHTSHCTHQKKKCFPLFQFRDAGIFVENSNIRKRKKNLRKNGWRYFLFWTYFSRIITFGYVCMGINLITVKFHPSDKIFCYCRNSVEEVKKPASFDFRKLNGPSVGFFG